MSRPFMFALVALTAVGGMSAAAAEPSSRPATRRIDIDGRPAVLVVPFQPLGDAAPPWVGDGIREDLAAELGRQGWLRVVELPPAAPGARRDAAREPGDPGAPQLPPKAAAPTPAEAARRAGRDAGADVAVYGSYQLVGDVLRITGRVIDVRSGNSLGTLKATGPLDDLFRLEDEVAAQARRLLRVDDGGKTGPGSAPVERPAAVAPAPYRPRYVTGPRYYPYDPSYTYGRAYYGALYVPYSYGYSHHVPRHYDHHLPGVHVGIGAHHAASVHSGHSIHAGHSTGGHVAGHGGGGHGGGGHGGGHH